MTTSSPYSIKPSQTLKKLLIAIAAFCFLGFADATYLTATHYLNVIPPCSITNGCETVLTSRYSEIYSVPVALIGAAYYLILLIFTIYLLTSFNNLNKGKIKILTAAAALGVLASCFLLYLQFFVIHAICLYCLASEVIATAIFILALFLLHKSHETPES